MPNKELIETIANNIDSLINTDLSGRQGKIQKLYARARARQGRSPTLVAAERLQEALPEPGKIVIISTGYISGYELRGAPLVVGSTDGPPGAVILARTLTQAFRAIPVLVTEEEAVGALSATARAAGLVVTNLECARKNVLKARAGTTVLVRGFPLNKESALSVSKDLVAELNPAAVIFIAKHGPNEKGVLVSSDGTRLPDQIRVDFLAEEARKRGALTIGVGDTGTEIGMALIKEGIRKDIPYAREAELGPLPAATETDLLVTGCVSNWGAYGICACLAAMLDKPQLLHFEELELAVLNKAAESGYVDPAAGLSQPFVDGVPPDVNASVVKLISTIVRKGLVGWLG